MSARTPLGEGLPDFPWDTLHEARRTAAAHPEGIVDLSVGTPVDAVAPGIQLALAEAAADPGYPSTTGSPELRAAAAAWLGRRHGASGLDADSVLAVTGTKEAIATLPSLLGIRRGTVIIPEIAYPTYEVAAVLADCRVLRSDSLLKIGPATPDLMFINSPSNPTGKVLGIEHLRKVVGWAQNRGVILVADECYIGLGWDDENMPLSILDPRVNNGDRTGLIAVHSLSKSSNLASYRAGFLAGDPALIAELTGVRRHLGMMVPGPVQHAMIAALQDDGQEQLQKLRYATRRAKLLPALLRAGFRLDDSEAGLYLWATRGEAGRDTVAWLAERGILAAPGDFYGPAGAEHVRVSLTATDERIDAAVARLRD